MRGGVEHLHAHYVTHAFTPHTHEGYVFAIVGAGLESFRYRGELHRLAPGYVSLLNPDEVHTGYAETDEGWVYRTCYPSTEIVASAVEAFSGIRKLPFFPQGTVYDPELAELMRRYHRLAEGADDAAREAAFLEVVACAVTRYADGRFRPQSVGAEPGAVRAVKAYLEAHVSEAVPLGTLAVLTELSPYTLLRAFRRATGLTPHAYQLQRRVELAKAQLHAGTSLAHVAAQTGFFDQSHFGKHFKRIVGVTPKAFARGLAISS